MVPEQDNRISNITWSINGQTLTKDYPKKEPLKGAAKAVLAQTNNSVDLDRWNLTKDGKKLDFNSTFEEANIEPGCVLVLSNKPSDKA